MCTRHSFLRQRTRHSGSWRSRLGTTTPPYGGGGSGTTTAASGRLGARPQARTRRAARGADLARRTWHTTRQSTHAPVRALPHTAHATSQPRAGRASQSGGKGGGGGLTVDCSPSTAQAQRQCRPAPGLLGPTHLGATAAPTGATVPAPPALPWRTAQPRRGAPGRARARCTHVLGIPAQS